MKEILLSAILVGVAALGGILSRFVGKKKHDNFIEEFAEKIIKDQTGVNIDLSPFGSPDPDGFNVIDVSNTLKKKDQKEE